MSTEFEPRRPAAGDPPLRMPPATERRSPWPVFGVLAALTVAIIVALVVTNLGQGTTPVASTANSGVATGIAPAAPPSATR